MQKFKPADFQTKLPVDKLIIQKKPEGEDVVPLDIVFVGAGPAGLAGAIHLARLVKKEQENAGQIGEVEIGVLEKAASLGGHNLSGAVVNPVSLQELFPELQISDFPFRGPVNGEKVFLLSESGKVRLPTPPTMHNKGNHVASICELVRWMGEKAEELGVNILPSFPADTLLADGDKIVGVQTAAMGLNRQGEPGEQYMPPTEISAKCVVLSEGTRGRLSQAYLDWKKIGSKYPQIYALGVKEVWRVKKPLNEVIHTLGWPLPKDTFGGSWLYPMGEDMVSFGLVAGLDYKEHNLDVHNLLQRLKKHPLFQEVLEGGELVEWGAKTIPEGGYNALPEVLHGDGILMLGDCAGFVNVPALKGIHYAIKSGILAAETLFEALKKDSFQAENLSSYDRQVHSSYIGTDLKKVRNMRHAFKSGFYAGGFKAALMTATGGAFPGDSGHHLEDAEENKQLSKEPVEVTGITKVDAVYTTGNKTRDDIPSHLNVGTDVPKEVAEMYVHMCPAGVYELEGDKLVVNAPNCVDCKATDVLGPRWEPREGGSGPNYTNM